MLKALPGSALRHSCLCVEILKYKFLFFHHVLTNSLSASLYTLCVQEVRKIYQIYIENIFLLNFVFLYSVWNVSLVALSAIVSQKKLLLSALAGALVSCICLFLPFTLWWRLFIGSILAFWICLQVLFQRTCHREMLGRALSITFLMAILLGGSIGLLQKRMGENIFSFWQMIILPPVLSFGIKRILIRYLPKKAKLLYPVILICGGLEYHLKGLLDTGNSLVEPISQKAVCIVGREIFSKGSVKTEKQNEFPPWKFRAIPYHSVGKDKGILCGYEMDCLIIDTDVRKVVVEKPVIGISEVPVGSSKTYQMILHPQLLREGEK